MISRPVDSGAGHFVADQLSNSSFITNIAYTPQDIESMYADIGKLHADGTSKTVPLQVILRETIVSIVRCMDNEQHGDLAPLTFGQRSRSDFFNDGTILFFFFTLSKHHINGLKQLRNTY